MSKLSPAALTVWSAFLDRYEWEVTKEELFAVAAALRAAALNFRTEMKGSVSNDFVRGVLAAATALEEIASELEAQ